MGGSSKFDGVGGGGVGGLSQYMGGGGGGFQGMEKYLEYLVIIANMKKYLQSDWLRGVQYWPYLYSVFNICTLVVNKKNQYSISVAEK